MDNVGGFIQIGEVLQYIWEYNILLVNGVCFNFFLFVIVLIDGVFIDKVVILIQVNLLKVIGVIVVVVGVGFGVDKVELNFIVLDFNYVFNVQNFDVLQILKEDVKKVVCDGRIFMKYIFI